MTRVGRGGATAKKRSTDDAQAEDAQILQNQRAQGKPSPKAGPTSATTGRSKRNGGSRSQHQTPLSAPVSAPTAVDEDSSAAALMEPSGSACLLPPPTNALLETPTEVSPTHASVRSVISEMCSSYGSFFPAGVDKAALCTSLCAACDEGSVVHTAGAAIDFDGLAKKVRSCFGQAVANAKPPADAPPPAMVPELAALRASKQFVEAAKAFLIPQDPAPPVAMPPSVQSTPGVLDAADAAINALAGRQPDPPKKKARGEKGAVKGRVGVLGMPGQPQQADGSNNGCIQTPENEGGLLSAPGPMMPQGGFTANAFSNDQSMMNQMPIAANGGVGLIFGSNPPPTTISDSMASALGLNFAAGGQQAYQHQQQAFIVGQHTGAGTARPPQVSNSRKKEVMFENLPEAFFDVTTSPLDGSCGPESQLLRNLIAHHCNQAEATMQQEWAAQQQFQEQQHASRSGAEKQPSETAMVYCHDTTLLSRFGFFPGQAPMNHAGAVTVNNNVQGMRLSAESKRAWVRLYDPVAANVIVFVGSKNGELVQGSPTSTRFATQEDTDAVHVAVRGDVAVLESELKKELPTIEGLGDWGAIMCGLPLPQESNKGRSIAEAPSASSAAPAPEATFEELESKLPTDFKTTEMKNLAETVEEIGEKKEELSLMAALGDAVDRQRKLTVLTQLSQLQPQVLPLQTAIRAQKIAKMKELGLPVPAHEWQQPQQDAPGASLPQGEAAPSNDATSGAPPTPAPTQPAFSSSSGSIENHNALLFFNGAAAPVPDNGVLAVLRTLKVTPKRVWRSKDSAAFCVETAGSGEAGRVATKLYHNQGQFMGMTVGRKQQ